jgi:hypothetical protein
MPHITGIVLLLCLPFAPADSAQDPNASARDLRGTWDDVTPEGPRVGYSLQRPDVTLTFNGTACTWQTPAGFTARQSLFMPVQAGTHRGLDFVTVSGGAFVTTRALFQVEGGTLTIKEAALDKPRPTNLSPWNFDGRNTDDFASVHVYKRRAK